MDVLVVDDEFTSRYLAAHTLQAAGYNVTMAQDGREALEILERGDHRLIVSDWRMPQMDGVELCRRVRGGGVGRYVYFILLTSRTEINDTIEGLNAGADDYIGKPFNPAELILRVNIGRRVLGLETREMTIFALAKLAESRDPDTGAHLERVRSYCRILAHQLRGAPEFRDQVNEEFVGLIYQTSPLHDIGKVAVPDAILLKPGRLSVEEFEIMKTHTIRGAETLDAVLAAFPGAPFLKMARDIALSHHERYDGGGYPHGLGGDEIPAAARIVAVADVYDALTSRRVYKEACPHDVAEAMIVKESGRHFDPAVVEAFLGQIAQIEAIREAYASEPGDLACEPLALR